jgi:hypothetical protein
VLELRQPTPHYTVVVFSSQICSAKIHCSDTVAFRLYLVIIVQLLTNYAQNVRLAKYNQTVQLVFNFIRI